MHPNHYEIDLNIDPDNHWISSRLNLTLYSKSNCRQQLNFYIYNDLAIKSITCSKQIDYEVSNKVIRWCPFITDSKRITVNVHQPPIDNEPLTIQFEYEGHIGITSKFEVNRITKEWIELGLYTPWYPLLENFELATFNVTIHLDNSYQIINADQINGNFQLNKDIPNSDCSIIASNKFRSRIIDFESNEIHVFYTMDDYSSEAEIICQCAKTILDFYKKFGQVQVENFSIIIAPRKIGGGYCRPDFILLTPADDEMEEREYFRFIAHELAHLWWHHAKNTNSWEDWLNESFAEYSALLALREKFGTDVFQEKINEYSNLSRNLPPIRNLNRSDNAHAVLYYKGPLLLCKLEALIGKSKFFKLLNIIHLQKISSTEKFLNIIRSIANKEIEERFASALLK